MPARVSISDSDRFSKPRSAMAATAASTICSRRMLATSMRERLRTLRGMNLSEMLLIRPVEPLLDRLDQKSQADRQFWTTAVSAALIFPLDRGALREGAAAGAAAFVFP